MPSRQGSPTPPLAVRRSPGIAAAGACHSCGLLFWDLEQAGEVAAEMGQGSLHGVAGVSMAVEEQPSLDRGQEGRGQTRRVQLEVLLGCRSLDESRHAAVPLRESALG